MSDHRLPNLPFMTPVLLMLYIKSLKSAFTLASIATPVFQDSSLPCSKYTYQSSNNEHTDMCGPPFHFKPQVDCAQCLQRASAPQVPLCGATQIEMGTPEAGRHAVSASTPLQSPQTLHLGHTPSGREFPLICDIPSPIASSAICIMLR